MKTMILWTMLVCFGLFSTPALAGEPAVLNPIDHLVAKTGELTESDYGIGAVTLRMPIQQVIMNYGFPSSTEPVYEEGASGAILMEWNYEAQGLSIDFVWTDEEWVAYSIAVDQKFPGFTVRGVGIGASYADVEAAYKGLEDEDFTGGERYRVNSVFDQGLSFGFVNDKVTSVIIGIAAE